MNDEGMKGLAYQALNLLRQNVKNPVRHPVKWDDSGNPVEWSDEGVNPVFGTVFPGEGFHRMKLIETQYGWMFGNSRLRGEFFGILRVITDVMKPEVTVFASPADMFLPTQKGWDLGLEEFHRRVREEYVRLKQEAFVTDLDCHNVMVQTEEKIAQLSQLTSMGKIQFKTKIPRVVREHYQDTFGFRFLEQSQFGGRGKMFGRPYDWPRETFVEDILDAFRHVDEDLAAQMPEDVQREFSERFRRQVDEYAAARTAQRLQELTKFDFIRRNPIQ